MVIDETWKRDSEPDAGEHPGQRLSPLVLPGLLGRSEAMKAMARHVRRCARFAVPVLLRGESGTGKEAAARAVHDFSCRSKRPFVAINGSLLGGDLGISALFGHVRGAFTGASELRMGALRRAHGGTLFIDEVASLSLQVQARLLRVVEDGWCEPLGADKGAKVDVRFVSATCEPIEQLVQQEKFRFDLFQRLSSCVIELPPLRKRGAADLQLLVRHLLQTPPLCGVRIDEGAMRLLGEQRWPGNVRELSNVLMQAAVMSDERVLGVGAVARALASRELPAGRWPPEALQDALDRASGNVSAAARHLGIPRSTFRDRLRREGMGHSARTLQDAETEPLHAERKGLSAVVPAVAPASDVAGGDVAVLHPSRRGLRTFRRDRRPCAAPSRQAQCR